MDVLYERVAGPTLSRCVRTPTVDGGRGSSHVRTFKTMTRSVEVLADWAGRAGRDPGRHGINRYLLGNRSCATGRPESSGRERRRCAGK